VFNAVEAKQVYVRRSPETEKCAIRLSVLSEIRVALNGLF